jgi:hypothetical protein
MDYEQESFDYLISLMSNHGITDEKDIFTKLSFCDFSINIIRKYKDKPWYWNYLTGNTIITKEEIIYNNLDLPWDIRLLNYELITWDVISRNLTNNLDWDRMHLVKDVDLNIIRSLPNQFWDYKAICYKYIDDITNEDIISWTKRTPLNWEYLISKNKINTELLYLLNDTDVNDWFIWFELSCHVKFDIIKKHPELPWQWDVISANNCTWNDYIENPELPWVLDDILRNKNITVEKLKTLSFANNDLIENKSFKIDKEEFIRNKRRQFFMRERKIGEELVKKVLHPKRLVKFLEMGYESEDFNHIYGN